MFRAHVLIIRRSKLHYTASGIITPISSGGQNCITQPLVSSHLYHQEVTIALHSLWYHHTTVLLIQWLYKHRKPLMSDLENTFKERKVDMTRSQIFVFQWHWMLFNEWYKLSCVFERVLEVRQKGIRFLYRNWMKTTVVWRYQRLCNEILTSWWYRCDDTRGCVMQFWPPDDIGVMIPEVV